MEIRPTEAALRLCFYLSYIRSLGVVGQALAREFPTEAAWQRLREDPEFIADLNHFTMVLEDIKTQGVILMAAETPDPERLARFVGQQYDVASEALITFAEKYHLPLEDLVYVLIHG